MTEINETCVNHVAPDKTIGFCSSERKWINKVLKLAEQRPNDVNIRYMPEDNQGMLCADLPASWLKISPPRQTNYTDEQRAAMVERLAAARDKKANEYEE